MFFRIRFGKENFSNKNQYITVDDARSSLAGIIPYFSSYTKKKRNVRSRNHSLYKTSDGNKEAGRAIAIIFDALCAGVKGYLLKEQRKGEVTRFAPLLCIANYGAADAPNKADCQLITLGTFRNVGWFVDI
ncbi:MAG: hypothetical protein MJE63_14215 [Proteobacteria bacterium]|nr:hypothetical protein [Pseudomonadota bacterium]